MNYLPHKGEHMRFNPIDLAILNSLSRTTGVVRIANFFISEKIKN